MHFSWFHLIPALEHYPDHVLTAFLVTLIIAAVCVTAKVVAGDPEAALIPDSKPTLRAFFEVVVESLTGMVDSVMGHDGAKYVPLVGAWFLYIIFNNLFGLIPGFNPATDNLNTTLPLGVVSFLIYNFEGMREHGVGKYFKHFMGPVWWLAWLILPIELISHLVRPVSLGLRLYGNMTGDHTVLSLFLGLVPIGIPMVFYLLGMFVCFVQAYVFSLLSMVYLSMATAHDH